MAPDFSPFADVLNRLQRDRNAQISVKVSSASGMTALTILPVQPEMVTIDETMAEIMLPYGLGRLTLHAEDLSAVQKFPASDSWHLEFGPLSIDIEFRGTP